MDNLQIHKIIFWWAFNIFILSSFNYGDLRSPWNSRSTGRSRHMPCCHLIWGVKPTVISLIIFRGHFSSNDFSTVFQYSQPHPHIKGRSLGVFWYNIFGTPLCVAATIAFRLGNLQYSLSRITSIKKKFFSSSPGKLFVAIVPKRQTDQVYLLVSPLGGVWVSQ
jgi:hypothetical protein